MVVSLLLVACCLIEQDRFQPAGNWCMSIKVTAELIEQDEFLLMVIRVFQFIIVVLDPGFVLLNL